jgi:Calcineurin-like phosphoesterase
MPTTIALRFRDLSGPTIPEHLAIIDERGSVWWAWWAKPSEQVPRDFLAQLLDRIAADNGVWIFLVDSGNNVAYRAHLIDISYAPANSPIPSPDRERTPAYYRDNQYRIWFELGEIREAGTEAADKITSYSYDELPPEQFTELDPAQGDFDGKRVFDIGELLGRYHRTIYFLREVRAGDPEHRVTLGPSVRATPFMKATLEVPSDYIVHLSDMHFGAQHAFPRHTAPPDRNLAIRIYDDLRRLYGETPPAAIILSGDFTWLGSVEEFQLAGELIEELQSLYRLESTRFIVCPGNHDIQWAPVQDGDVYAPAAPVKAAKPAAEQNYRGFVSRHLQVTFPADSLAMGRRLLLSNFMPVDIVALNSSRLEQRHFAGYGFVSRQQLVEAAEAMGWGTQRETGPKLRVLVLHHHVVPVMPVEEIQAADQRYSLTLDAAELLYTALEYGVDLIVHGHMHQPFAAAYSRIGREQRFPADRRLAIQAAGSCGVKTKHIPDTFGRNSFCIYEVSETGLKVRVRATSDDSQGFGEYFDYNLSRDLTKGLVAGA